MDLPKTDFPSTPPGNFMTDKFLEMYVWCSLLLQSKFIFVGGGFLFIF